MSGMENILFNKIAGKVLPLPMLEIRIVNPFVMMALPGQYQHIEILSRFYQCVRHTVGIAGMYVFIRFAGDEQQVPLQVFDE